MALPRFRTVPAAAAKGYVITTEDSALVLNKNATNVKANATGEYEITVAAKDCGCEDVQPQSKTITLKVIAKNTVDLTSVMMMLPAAYMDKSDYGFVPEKATPQVSVLVNGVKASGVKVEWTLEAYDGNEGTATVSAKGKLDMKNAVAGDKYTLKCKLTDNADETNVAEAIKTIDVVKKLDKTDISLLTVDGNIPVQNLKYTPGDEGDSVYVSVPDGAFEMFTVQSSNAKLLEVVQTEVNRWKLTPKGVGTATITVAARDGSNVKQTFKVKVSAVNVPVNAITVVNKTLNVRTGTTIGIPFSVTGKKGREPTMPDVQWEVSDQSKASLVTGRRLATTHETEGTLGVRLYSKGKITLTGRALDGSNKTVKITLNIVSGYSPLFAEELMLTAPAGAATDGRGDIPVLVWGKSMQLKASLRPFTAKSKNIGYEVVDTDTGNPVEGITVKNGKLTVAKTAQFTGTVTVRAYLKDYMLDRGNDYAYIEDTLDIDIKAPLTKIAVTNAEPMKPGERRQLNVQLEQGENLVGESEYPLLWSVNNKSLATVDQYGVVTVKDTAKPGKTFKVTAATQDGSGKKVTVTIKVAAD